MVKQDTRMLFVLFGTAFIAAFNENIINVGLADIMSEFSITANTANWLVTGYMIITSIVVTVVAFLIKRLTLRSLFFTASGVFIVGSVLAIFAPTFPILLVCRLIQAIGTGIFIPTMMNTILVVAPRSKLGTYLSIGGCCITFGPAFGPVVSGFMTTLFGWRTMFLVPVVVMVILVVAGAVLVRNITATEKVKLDIPSLLMSIVGLTAVVYGLAQITSQLAISLVMLAIGIVVIALFVIRQNRCEHPLLNLEPMKNRRFSMACALVVVAMMTTFSMSVLLPLYFESAVGTSALVAGALVLIPILAQALFAIIGGRAMDKRGEWPLLPMGFLVVTIGQAAVCLVAAPFGLIGVVIAAVVVYAGVGLTFSPSQTAGLKVLPRELNAHGVSIMSTFIQVSAALGPSLFVGVLSSGSAAQAAAGAATSVAQTAGFSQAVAVAAAIALIGCVVAFVYARLCVKADAHQESPAAQAIDATAASAAVARPTLSNVMFEDVFTISESAPVYAAVQQMLDHDTSGLPVVSDDNEVVGFISDGDVIKAFSDDDAALADLTYVLSSYFSDQDFDTVMKGVMESNVMDLATKHVISVDAGATLEQTCSILGKRHIKKAPVLKDGKLVGTVCRNDITRYLLSSFVKESRLPQSA